MSIGSALSALLTTNAALVPIHGGRVYAVKFAQAKAFPAMTYNTEGVKRLECRTPGPDRIGVVELALLTDTYEQMEQLSEAVITLLENQTHLSDGFRLRFSRAEPDYTEVAEDLKALYRRIEFSLHARPI